MPDFFIFDLMTNKTALDRLLHHAAYWYIVIPFLIFCVGWLKWFYSLPVITVVIIAATLSLKNHVEFRETGFRKHRKVLLLSLGCLLVWILLSGIGQFSFQTDDHYARNAILKDLVEKDWPLVYDFKQWQPFGVKQPGTYMLVYYIGYWMPAAAIGKVFGLTAAHAFLFLWTFTGISLTFYFICRFLKRISIWIAILFVFYSGMDIVPVVLGWNYHPLYHLEWWHNNFQQYSSNSSLLYWVFNQTIVPWLIVAMLVNNLPKQNIVFLCAFCLFYAPFPFLGLLPLALYFLFRNDRFYTSIKNSLSFQNTIATLVILLILAGYYSSNTPGKTFNLFVTGIGDLLWFYSIEFLILLLLVLLNKQHTRLLLLLAAVLAIFPFIQYRGTPDLTMRGSIPALFLLMILAANTILNSRHKLLRSVIICCLLIGSVTALNELTRSMYFTGKYWYYVKIKKQQPNFELIQKPDLFKGNNPVILSVIGNTNSSFFYKTFCKQ